MVAFGMSDSGRSEQRGLRPRRPSFKESGGRGPPVDDVPGFSEAKDIRAPAEDSSVNASAPVRVERLNPRKVDGLDEVPRTDVTVYADHVNVTAAPNQAGRKMKPDFTLSADDPVGQFVWMIVAVVGGVAIGSVAGVISGLLWFS